MAKRAKKKSSRRSKQAPAAEGARRTAGLSSLPTDALHLELKRRQRSIGKLLAKRDKLAEQLTELNHQIAALGGPSAAAMEGLTARGTPRKRPRNDSNLAEALAALLKNQTMSVTQASEEVQRAGYQTTAANFRTIVNQTLIRDKRFKKVSRGKYTAA
jgi:hypothetical protein